MRKAVKEAGNRYGKLLVLKRAKGKYNGAAWLCQCDCGREIIKLGYALRTGNIKSCGCLRNFPLHKLPPHKAAFNALIRGVKLKAESRDIKWFLTEDQVRILTKQDCHYCGAEPQQIIKGTYNGAYVYNGLDRVDNTKEYMLDNVVPCCGVCNIAKNAMTIEEFKKWITRVYLYYVRED